MNTLISPSDVAITPDDLAALLDGVKENRQAFANRVIQSIEDGLEDALKMYIRLKKLQEACAMVIDHKAVKSAAMSELSLHGQKEVEIYGAKATMKEVGVKYDYGACRDSRWAELSWEKEALLARLKERETFLKTIPEGGVVNPDTGEIIYKPVKTSTTAPVITLL